MIIEMPLLTTLADILKALPRKPEPRPADSSDPDDESSFRLSFEDLHELKYGD